MGKCSSFADTTGVPSLLHCYYRHDSWRCWSSGRQPYWSVSSKNDSWWQVSEWKPNSFVTYATPCHREHSSTVPVCLYRVGVLDVKPLASGLYSNFHDSEWTGFVLIKTSCLEKVVSGLFWWVSLFYCRLPLKQQRDYKNVFDAMFRITREEGILTLWRVSTLAQWWHSCLL